MMASQWTVELDVRTTIVAKSADEASKVAQVLVAAALPDKTKVILKEVCPK